MCTAKAMTQLQQSKKEVTVKYVLSTSRENDAIHLACGMQLNPQDFVFPYYRDDSILLGIGMTPKDLMLQLLAKKSDPFSGGRTYYSHTSLRRDGMPKLTHNSRHTGMQAIPNAWVVLGIPYSDKFNLDQSDGDNASVIC